MTPPRPARRAFFAILAAAVLAATTARAQNVGSTVQNALRNQFNNTVNATVGTTFRSITQPGSGRVATTLPMGADTEGRVVFYRTQQCGYCKRAAAYMDQNGIPYAERYVDRNSDYNAEFTRLGGRGVPFLVFGSRTLSGFDGPLISRYYQEMRGAQGTAYRAPPGNPAAGYAPPPPYPAAPVYGHGGATQPVGGEALALKLSVLNILAAPSHDAPVLVTLTPSDRLVYLGEERNGLYRVASDKGEGWVDKRLVRSPRDAW